MKLKVAAATIFETSRFAGRYRPMARIFASVSNAVERSPPSTENRILPSCCESSVSRSASSMPPYIKS